MTHQMGVVLLVVLPESGGHWYNQRHVGDEREDLVVQWLAKRQEMGQLVLCCEQILAACPPDHVGQGDNCPP